MKYDDKIQFLFPIKIHGNFFDKYFLILNALHCIIANSNFKFQQEQNLPGYLAISQILGIWVEFGKTFFNVISQ